MASLVCLILVMLWTTEGSSLSLTYSPITVGRHGTHNLTLTCSVNELNETHSDVSPMKVEKMRILKLGNKQWKTVIAMESSWRAPNVFDGQKGSASVGENGINHLQVTCTLATDEQTAEYFCDILGYTQNNEAIGKSSQTVFVDVEAPVSVHQLFSILQTTNKELKKALTKISTNEKKLDQSQKTLDALSSNYFGRWPQGVYGLLQPQAGCPADVGVTWKHGYRTHNTQSQGINKDAVSSPAHMKQPIMWKSGSSKLMRQNFCSVDKESNGRLWPAGSYCVNRFKHETCPLGFKGGDARIKWDDENTSNKNDKSGTHPVNGVWTETVNYYCCRNDRSPQTPIHLPRSKPFYLYRYGGTCQQVAGMKVTPEYMFFDTENSGSRYYLTVPDGKDALPNVKLHLCYYETT